MAEDIISTLPDHIICHILSFLSTEESVATSILSKRWNHLWLSVPVLDFTNLVIEGSDANFRFNDFVYSVLFSRDPALPIKTFHFDVHYQYNDRTNILRIPSFTKWINFVLQHGVECLDLCLHGWDVESCCLPKLPITIFTCSTLVVLKIGLFEVNHSFSSVELPLLKTLHLQSITFPEDQDLRLLLGGCPILEELMISRTYYESEVDSLNCGKWKNFRLSNLKQADVDSSYLHFPFQALQNVNSLRIEIAKEYCCNDAVPIFHNLTRLDLTFSNYRWHILIEVFKHCPKLQYLGLDETEWKKTTGIYDQKNWVDPDFVPPCLLLHLRTCYIFSFLGLPGELCLAKYILKNARVLHTMKIWTIGQLKTKRLLSSYPRASSTCKLTFQRDPGA